MTFKLRQERINLRELIPHIGPLTYRNPSKVIFGTYRFSCGYSLSSRIAWKFRGGAESTKTCRECKSCDEYETREDKEGLPPLMRK